LSEDELLWLTVRLAQVARQMDPGIELSIGITQPWGEFMAFEERKHSPFLFADTLVRSDLNLAALDIEVVMGVAPRGSYCRDQLELSRLLDLYALIGIPLSITLGYPSLNSTDALADQQLRVGAGRWGSAFSAETQANWAASFAALVACKSNVRGINWVHLSDADPHQFPHCGLIDAQGTAKPAIERLQHLRSTHLR
jgi:hypothetical protein